ncbi:hypothetical protein Tco_1287778 [Tanacetum coccineum]
MAQENYIEGCSMQRPHLLEPNGFCFWNAHFETYVNSKDNDLWQVIQNGDFYFEVEDSKTKLMKETPYELLKDEQKKQLGENNKVKMTLYNALPRKEYERVFICKTAKEVWHTLIITHQGNSQVKNFKIDILTQEYEKFSISNKETIDSGFTRFNAIVTSLKSLDPDYSINNHVRKFLRALSLKWRAKVKSLALKAKVTRKQTGDDRDSQGGSDEDADEEEEAKHLIYWLGTSENSSARETDSDTEIDLVMVVIDSVKAAIMVSKVVKARSQKGLAIIAGLKSTLQGNVESQRRTRLLLEEHGAIVKMATNTKITQHENEELLKFNKDFAKTFEKPLNEKRSLENENSKLSSKINDLEIEVKKLANDKEVIEPCKTCDVLTKEVDSLKCNVSKLQNKALNFSKFKESNIALDDMLSRQKSSQDKEDLGF